MKWILDILVSYILSAKDPNLSPKESIWATYFHFEPAVWEVTLSSINLSNQFNTLILLEDLKNSGVPWSS